MVIWAGYDDFLDDVYKKLFDMVLGVLDCPFYEDSGEVSEMRANS
jgi:hypothetical protein